MSIIPNYSFFSIIGMQAVVFKQMNFREHKLRLENKRSEEKIDLLNTTWISTIYLSFCLRSFSLTFALRLTLFLRDMEVDRSKYDQKNHLSNFRPLTASHIILFKSNTVIALQYKIRKFRGTIFLMIDVHSVR